MIALNTKPRTIKELFSTDLLEGYSVFYNNRDKVDLIPLLFIFQGFVWTFQEI